MLFASSSRDVRTGYDLPSSIAGVKRAAQRKLDHELGIKDVQLPTEEMRYLIRMHYLSPSGQGLWGEHESTPSI